MNHTKIKYSLLKKSMTEAFALVTAVQSLTKTITFQSITLPTGDSSYSPSGYGLFMYQRVQRFQDIHQIVPLPSLKSRQARAKKNDQMKSKIFYPEVVWEENAFWESMKRQRLAWGFYRQLQKKLGACCWKSLREKLLHRWQQCNQAKGQSYSTP